MIPSAPEHFTAASRICGRLVAPLILVHGFLIPVWASAQTYGEQAVSARQTAPAVQDLPAPETRSLVDMLLQRLENPEGISVLVLGALVFFLAFFRFNQVPPRQPAKSDKESGAARLLESAKYWAIGVNPDLERYLPPPRSNTTFIRFWFYRFVYAFGAVAVFVALFSLGPLRSVLYQILAFFDGEVAVRYEFLGPLALAFAVAGLAPIPFRGVEQRIRSGFYDLALIDGKLRREVARLRNPADFQAQDLIEQGVVQPNAARDRVWTLLKDEGFRQEDLVYDPNAPQTPQSLWTKASLLMQQISYWEQSDRYVTAFSKLKEMDRQRLSRDAIFARYNDLKGRALACFNAMRDSPEESDKMGLCAEFRSACEDLLEQAYMFLARVSLVSHVSDNERRKSMAEIGLKLKAESPLPDANELGWLVLILLVVVLAPLLAARGVSVSTAAIFVLLSAAVLVPIVLAYRFPALRRRRSRVPAVAFPISAFAVSAVLGAAVGLTLIATGTWEERWMRFVAYSWRWDLWMGGVSAMIAVLMHLGTAHTAPEAESASGSYAWGSLRDASVLLTFSAPVIALLFGEIALEQGGFRGWAKIGIPLAYSLCVGYFVPTWYRTKYAEFRERSPRSRAGRDDQMTYQLRGAQVL